MRKRFADDELLSSFRLKQKPGLRIDFKPTPPEQVEDMIKELEPVLESLSDQAPITSNLGLDWDISSIATPAHLPTEEELKALLAFEPTREDTSETPEIFRTQRHQKMLELLKRVEALTRSDNEAMTSEGAVEIKSPDSSLFAQAKNSANTQVAFSNKSGEDHVIRSSAESQPLNSDRSAASVAQMPSKPSEVQSDLKLNLEQAEFQERLIRILNENYGDLGEVRPHNLKARLIEILNEEYSEDEDIQENEKVESEVPLENENVSDDPASFMDLLEETGPPSAEDHAEGLIKDSVLQGFDNAAAQRQSRASQPLAGPRVLERGQPAHFRDKAHPWLKELQSEGHPHPHDTSMSETSQSPLKAEQSTYKVKAATLNRREAGEKDFKEDLLFSEASSPPRAQGERSMPGEDWSFVLDTMKEQMEYLKKQLEIKDHQLQNKDELIRNFQILLKNEQDKFLKLEHKMDDVVAQVEERATKKGFFSRFRKR